MSKLVAFLACLIVASAVTAGILALQAEAAQNQVHSNLFLFVCRKPSQRAFNLGFAAAILMLLTHIITNLLGGCNYLFFQEELRQSPTNRQLSKACLFSTWVTLVVVLLMLGVGTFSNHKSWPSCGFVPSHFLSTGANLCFVHGISCVAYYLSTALRPVGNQGIAYR